jgi:hypothetical protein
MDLKNWETQNYYNEYLELKSSIIHLKNTIDFIKSKTIPEEIEKKEELLATKIDRVKFVLEQLELRKVDLKELILLAMNVDIEN